MKILNYKHWIFSLIILILFAPVFYGEKIFSLYFFVVVIFCTYPFFFSDSKLFPRFVIFCAMVLLLFSGIRNTGVNSGLIVISYMLIVLLSLYEIKFIGKFLFFFSMVFFTLFLIFEFQSLILKGFEWYLLNDNIFFPFIFIIFIILSILLNVISLIFSKSRIHILNVLIVVTIFFLYVDYFKIYKKSFLFSEYFIKEKLSIENFHIEETLSTVKEFDYIKRLSEYFVFSDDNTQVKAVLKTSFNHNITFNKIIAQNEKLFGSDLKNIYEINKNRMIKKLYSFNNDWIQDFNIRDNSIFVSGNKGDFYKFDIISGLSLNVTEEYGKTFFFNYLNDELIKYDKLWSGVNLRYIDSEDFNKIPSKINIYDSKIFYISEDGLINSNNLFVFDLINGKRSRVFNKNINIYDFSINSSGEIIFIDKKNDYQYDLIYYDKEKNYRNLPYSGGSGLIQFVSNKEFAIVDDNLINFYGLENSPTYIMIGNTQVEKIRITENIIEKKSGIISKINYDEKGDFFEVKISNRSNDLNVIVSRLLVSAGFVANLFRFEKSESGLIVETDFFDDKILLSTSVELLADAIATASPKYVAENINLKINNTIFRVKGGI